MAGKRKRRVEEEGGKGCQGIGTSEWLSKSKNSFLGLGYSRRRGRLGPRRGFKSRRVSGEEETGKR